MKQLSKVMTVMVAGLVMSTGAYATEIDVPASNLGATTVAAAQSDTGFLGLSQVATGAIMLGLGAIVVFKAIDGTDGSIDPPVAIPAPNTGGIAPPPPAHH